MSKGNPFKNIWRALSSNTMEIVITVIMVALFLKTPAILHWIDPYSRAVDLSYLHLWVMKVMMVCASITVTWLIVQFAFPTLDHYMEKGSLLKSKFREDWNGLKGGTRVGILFGTIAFILICILFA